MLMQIWLLFADKKPLYAGLPPQGLTIDIIGHVSWSTELIALTTSRRIESPISACLDVAWRVIMPWICWLHLTAVCRQVKPSRAYRRLGNVQLQSFPYLLQTYTTVKGWPLGIQFMLCFARPLPLKCFHGQLCVYYYLFVYYSLPNKKLI